MESLMQARWASGVLIAALLSAGSAHAGLFDDSDARKAILEVRQKQEQADARVKASQAETTQTLEQLRRSLLDLNNQIESLRTEISGLRNQNEQLARDVSELQRAQKDVQQGVDERLRKFEPQKVSVDGKDFQADGEEKRSFEEAMATMRKSDFAQASSQLSAFLRRYPNSGFKPTAWFWLGNAQYGMRDYKAAMDSFRALVTAAPDHPRAPEAVLSIANCQLELKDTKGARRTLDELLKTYPKSEAALAGKERLASLR